MNIVPVRDDKIYDLMVHREPILYVNAVEDPGSLSVVWSMPIIGDPGGRARSMWDVRQGGTR